MFKSAVNQPNRVVIRSDDDDTSVAQQNFYQFSVNLPTPILDAKTADIIRATLPNANINIPDYQLTFWYHRLATETTAPSSSTLRCVRLYPSWWKEPDGYTSFSRNRYFTDPSDLVAALNAAASNDNTTNNPYFQVGDITFTYDSTTKRISFSGNNAGSWYAPAGFSDPSLIAALRTNTITMPAYAGVGSSTVNIPQPYAIGYTLNLRLGFAMSGIARGLNSYTPGANTLCANSTNWPEGNGTALLADSYPNLVYTNSVFLYTNIVNGASSCSNNRQNLLAVVPVNSAPLGITNYQTSMETDMVKVSGMIQNITIEMRDDADQPYFLPDSASVNVEIYFKFA